MRRPRRIILQRRRMFIGCEGESEQSYVALLARLADAQGLRVFLDAVLLQPGGGDPLAIVERAAQRLRERESKRGEPYEGRFVLLDDDKRGQAPQRDQRIPAVAAQAQMYLIWQRPCHEALLLRHLVGCANLRPITTPAAGQQLTGRWPGYAKATPAARLAEQLDQPALTRAAAVEPDLAVLLAAIGLVDET